MSQISLKFPDSAYTSSNKPSADTLKADLATIETGLNDTDGAAIKKDGSVEYTSDQAMGDNKITGLGAGTAATDAASLGAVYPIGAVFLSVVSTDPSTLLGFGTWARIAEAQMLVGFKTGDADFGTVMGTGGAKTVSVAHTHTGPSHTHTGPSHTHTVTTQATLSQVGNYGSDHFERGDWGTSTHNHGGVTGAAGTGNTGASGTGNTGAMSANATPSIINPYYVVYAWKRTA